MRDYNRPAACFWWLAAFGGGVALAWALFWRAGPPAGVEVLVLVLVGMGIAMAAGVFVVQVSQSTHAFTAGEAFLFLLLLRGPKAALLAAAGEAAVGSWRTSERWTSRLASPAMAGLSVLAVGGTSQVALNWLQQRGADNAGLLVVMAMAMAMAITMAFSLACFFLNTLLETAVAKLKRREWWTASELFAVFGWVGIAYAGSATVAVLLFLAYQQTGLGVLMATVPLLGMLLATLYQLFGHQEVA